LTVAANSVVAERKRRAGARYLDINARFGVSGPSDWSQDALPWSIRGRFGRDDDRSTVLTGDRKPTWWQLLSRIPGESWQTSGGSTN
jgi:hypothetical protein